MVNLMKKEQADDEKKKDYCNQEFSIAEGKSKDLNIKVEQSAATIHNNLDAVDKLKDEIAALQDGIKSLDASLAEAATNRKAEHSEYEDLISSNSEAVRLLGAAKERLNKFYNPSLTTDTTTTSNPYALSLVQINLHRNDTDQAPPPTFSGSYKAKGEESNGVLGMLTTLSHDLQQEMTIAKTQEKTSQKEYEQTVADAKQKREADINSINSKAKAKADFETDLNEAKGQKKSREDEVEAVKKYVVDLHGQCDWLIKNFDLRKQARTDEQESLTNAKAVLAGADFS
jgi:chromosome segregation ATPase